MDNKQTQARRLGLVIDIDRCSGCGACMVACAVENNVAPDPPRAGDRKGITLLKVARLENGAAYPQSRSAFFPVMCQQCGHEAPCVSVCPQQAVDVDPNTGVVGQVPQRCLGCRYCMAACPYHARYFNWWDPSWPAGMEVALNPGVAPRMRGVVEKCNLCHARWQAARAKSAVEGKRGLDPADALPACAEACPSRAITFGDLADATSQVARLAKSGDAFRLLEPIGTDPKVYYVTKREWVKKEALHG